MVTFKKIKQTVTGKLLVEGECISTDSKPVDIIANGSKLFEIDTGSWYFFNESGAEWVKSVRGGAGNITVDELIATENGTYTPEDEQHAFGPVIVNVPPAIPEGAADPADYNDGDLLITEVKNVPPNSSNHVHSFKDANDNYVYTIVTTVGAIPLIADPKGGTGVVSNVMDSLVVRALECGGSACMIVGNEAESSERAYLFRPKIPAYADGREYYNNITDLGTFAASAAKFNFDESISLGSAVFAIWNCTSGPSWNFRAYMYDPQEGAAGEVTQQFRNMQVTLVVTVPALSYEYAGYIASPSVAFGINKLYKHFSNIAEISWCSIDNTTQDNPYTSYVDGDHYSEEISQGEAVNESFYTGMLEALEIAADVYSIVGWGIRDESGALIQKCGVEYTDFLTWMLSEPQFKCDAALQPDENMIQIWAIYDEGGGE